MIEAIDILKVELLPGSRHGIEGPTAVVRLRWRGTTPTPEQLAQLEERLAHALWFLERLAWKKGKYLNWRECRPSIPVRDFPDDFLLESAPEPVAGLLAAGIMALQWGSLLPVTAARVLHHEGQEIALAVPW